MANVLCWDTLLVEDDSFSQCEKVFRQIAAGEYQSADLYPSPLKVLEIFSEMN